MTIAYVVTSKGNDVFADMALVSIMSARITNPGWRLVLICDRNTVEAATACRHRMLKLCDEVIAVDTPEGDPVFVNRWIKTQAIRWVSDACLLLDTDTLIRRSLDDLPNLVEHLGAVPNHNAADASGQIWEEDLEELRRMDWPTEFVFYANGGALFYKPTDKVKEFFALWHGLYLESVRLLGRNRDQPSLNTAIVRSRVAPVRLPDSLNFQLQAIIKGWSGAAIWHYYSSFRMENTFYENILNKVPDLSNDEIEKLVVKAVSAEHPFLAMDDVASRIASLSDRNGRLTPWQKRWLETDAAEVHLEQLSELETRWEDYDRVACSIKSLTSELTACRSHLEAVRADLGTAHTTIDVLQADLGTAHTTINSLQSSRSWRVTKPLRIIDACLKRWLLHCSRR